MRVFLQYFSTFPQQKKTNVFFFLVFFPPPEDVQKVQAMNEGSILFGLSQRNPAVEDDQERKKYNNAIIRRALV